MLLLKILKQMKNKIFLLLFLALTIVTCSKKDRTFYVPEIGWTIELIDNWTVENLRKTDSDIQKGIEILKKRGIEFKLNGKEISLLTLRKNTITKFQATIVPFKESYKGEWKDKYPLIKKYIYTIFTSQGFKVDTTSNKEKINNIDFEVFNLKMYRNNKQEMEQTMYRTYINNYDFIINMTNNDTIYKKQMLDILRKSKFELDK